ncbi:protein IWS1 homolog 1 [Tanacetum coccineum]
MGYENDPYRDEDGEPLMDYDDGFQSDHGDDNQQQQPQHLIDENLEDELDDNDWDNDRQNRSPTPVYNESDSKSKPRKRLIKKTTVEESVPDFVDEVEDDVAEFVREDSDGSGGGKRKKMDSASGGSAKKKKFSSGKFTDRGGERERGGRSGEKSGSKSKGNGKRRSGEDAEVKEMWETVAGGDSETFCLNVFAVARNHPLATAPLKREKFCCVDYIVCFLMELCLTGLQDDKDGPRLADDDNFIDDTGVDPGDRYGSDQGGYSPSRAPQAEEGEEDDEVRDMFKVGKKKKKTEKSAAEIALLVENVMAELEVVAEEDAELNRQSKPAINKLRKLPLLTEVLSKKQLQLEFLDHGVLTLLRNWLEPLPDGSLPNINIRAAILRILTEFPIDLDQYDRREQLKKSGLGKVIMFLSKSDEETTSNRKLAKDLVDKWSRPIFNKSTRFEDMRNFEDERMPIRRPSMKKPMNKSSGMQSRDDDLDLAEYSQEPKSGSSSSSSRLTSRPEAMSLDFVVRPQSKIDPDEVRARAKQVVQDQRRLKMNKRLQQLKAPKKKQLQATKLSVEGRGMVKYL